MSDLSGRHHRGKRAVQELVETVFQVPVSLGTVVASEQQMSAVFTEPHEQAGEAVRNAPVKNADETGWKRAGQRCWLCLLPDTPETLARFRKLRAGKLYTLRFQEGLLSLPLTSDVSA
ncbi:hypothetical protein BH23PLA1_BH23PLA1_10400 [soil metagenome]